MAMAATHGICEHWFEIPYGYPTYVDGHGMTNRGKRWEHYCWRCRLFWRASDGRDRRNNRPPQNEPDWAFPTQPSASSTPSSSSGTRGRSERAGPLLQNPLRDPTEHDGSNSSTLTPNLVMTGQSVRRSNNHTDSFRVGLSDQSDVAGHSYRQPQPQPQIPQLQSPSSQYQPPPPPSMPPLPQRQTQTTQFQFRPTQQQPPSLPPSSQRQPQPSQTQPQPRPRENPFGTPEEWQATDYQSPLNLMFNRAWSRYRDAEDARRRTEAENQDRLLQLANHGTSQQIPSGNQNGSRAFAVGPTTFSSRNITSNSNAAPNPSEAFARMTSDSPDGPPPVSLYLDRISAGLDRHAHPPLPEPEFDESVPHSVAVEIIRRLGFDDNNDLDSDLDSESEGRENPIDIQAKRPEPVSAEDMTVSIACKICCEQKVDVLVLPCSHLAICRWCAGILKDKARQDRRERRHGNGMLAAQAERGEGWKCPICRKPVETTKRVFLG